jgi:hypothetical protein
VQVAVKGGEPYDSKKERDSVEASARAVCRDPSKLSY